MLIGYARPSAGDPDCEAQRALLIKAGCNEILLEEHAFHEKRELLQKLLEKVTAGDRLIVYRLYTWADSTPHLMKLLNTLESKGVSLYSIQENIEIGTGKEYPFANILSSLADFQSDAISEKTKAGMSAAKQNGAIPGRPRKPDKNIQKAIELHKNKQCSLAEINEKTGISKSTLYRYLEN